MTREELEELKGLATSIGLYDDKNPCKRAVILGKAIEALEQTRWIPVKFRPLTEEEQEQYPDYCYMADYPMPDEGEEILVSTIHGTVEKDECGIDDGFYLDSGYDWQTDIVAWKPLPEPYKEESEVGE